MKLQIGGTERRDGWTNLNIQDGPDVDIVGNVTDLTQFADESVDQVYASHIFEHLGYMEELPLALKEVHRILKPGRELLLSVPNLETLCEMMLSSLLDVAQKFHVMRIMFGGQTDPHDYHKVGITSELLQVWAADAGFSTMRAQDKFDLFTDCSVLNVFGYDISLNVVLVK